MTRDEIIALIVSKAHEHGIEPWELLGGAIAESGLNPAAWRQGTWPDWSAGLFQQTVKYADEGDQSASPENVALIKDLYFNPAHACDVAAKKYLYWRHGPDVPPLTAWVAYNGPSYYHTPDESPNVENYRAALAEARRILGVTTVPTYNPDTPLILQNDDWSCWPTSARMAVESFGRHPTEAWFEAQAIADGIESTAVGLEDGSGAAGAAWLTRQYNDPSEGTPTLKAHNAATVSFDDVKSVAGTTAVMLGGHNWGQAGHWVFVRRYNPAADSLELGNPAGTYAGIGQVMSRQQFSQVAPCSMIVVTADGAVAPAPLPVPDPIFKYVRPGDVGSGLLAMMAADGTEPAMPSTFLPLGRSPAMIEEAQGLNGTIYKWHLPTNRSWKYPAARP